MPIEILETISHINYNTPRPRPIDPASLFDLVKIRRLVDEATNLAVRAASGIASPILTNVHGGVPDASLGSFGLGGSPHGAKLSRERKFRMREQASQKLARAYRLDEIACSVATMQGASPLEDVGNAVLQRNPKDLDATYVHFFHEKIPSRQLAESTDVQPLRDILNERTEAAVLRTVAYVGVIKEQLEEAAQDLTHALSVSRFHSPLHQSSQEKMQLQEPQPARRRPQDVILADKDQPSGLDGQLLFMRGSVYLNMAWGHVGSSLPAKQPQDAPTGDDTTQTHTNEDVNEVNPSKSADQEAIRGQVESRKLVKTFAKRALRDFMAFVSRFEYAPYMPLRPVKEFNDRIDMAAQGARNTRPSDALGTAEPHKIYTLGDLFAAVPPSDIPPYPSQDIVKSDAQPQPSTPETTCEMFTYHPLLIEALHALLLCHCLAQTSPKELQRHAYMVARLARLSDGYPVFQQSRSSSRSDWMEILRQTDNWLGLSSSWDTLCHPAPIPIFDGPAEKKSEPSPGLAASAAKAMINGGSVEHVAEEMRKERVREQAIMEALDDERVTDEASFRASILAREKRAEEDYSATAVGKPTNGAHANGRSDTPAHHDALPDQPVVKRWASSEDPGKEYKEYPVHTERVTAITLWIREAPVVTGTAKRKKKTKKSAKADHVEAGMRKLDMENPAQA